MNRPFKNVYLADIKEAKAPSWKYSGKIKGVFRRGTAKVSAARFCAIVGDPHNINMQGDGIDGAGKVHVQWFFHTPRGTVEIHDYWWNGENELSIASGNNKSAMWMKGWLRHQGIETQ